MLSVIVAVDPCRLAKWELVSIEAVGRSIAGRSNSIGSETPRTQYCALSSGKGAGQGRTAEQVGVCDRYEPFRALTAWLIA